ncbi:MAG TPA: AAA family ATPase [Candidatus Nitrosocosmicus sp.]|nr:AAA family ATPase [Candidatus Nitrosocosmicus sp.]
MSFASSQFVICLTGMPGAGKSTVAAFLKERGFFVITMGDVIREKAKEKNLPLDDKSLGELMKDFRRTHGNDIIANLTMKRIKELKDKCLVVVDGIRSYDEFKVLKSTGFVKLLAIHAASNIRYGHIINRERSDTPANHESFLQRDEREMNVGISKAIALADESISNNNLTINELKLQVETIIEKWLHEYNNSNLNNKVSK